MITENFNINDNSFHNFIDFFTAASDIQISDIEEDSYEDIARMLVKTEEEVADMLALIYTFKRVIYFNVVLMKDDFTRLVSKIFPVKDAANDDLVVYIHSEEKDSLYYFELVKYKKTRNVKTIQVIESELNEAIQKEDYELATKLRDKMVKMKKRKKL